MDSKQIEDNKKEIMKNIENIKKMGDEELMDKIREVNEDQLKNIGLMAYTELFNRAVYLNALIEQDEELIEELRKEEPKFKELYDMFKNDILTLDSVRFLEKEELQDIDRLKEIRRETVVVLRALTSYATELSYANEITKDKAYINFIKENFSDIEENMDLDRLVGNVQMFLSEDGRTIKNKVMDITSVLPVKITTAKYYDLIENAFKKTMREAGKEMIDVMMNRYKALFDGSLVSEYGVYFDKYFMEAEKANKFDFKNASEQDMADLYNETSKDLAEITAAANIIREFGIITNRIIAVSMLKDYIAEGLNDNDIKTLLTDWNNYLSNPESNRVKVMKSFNHVFEKLDKVFQENNRVLQELTMENFNRGNKVDDELKDSLQKSQYILSYINDYNLEDEYIPEMINYVPAGEVYLKQAIQGLIDYMNRNSKDMQNIQRKARMKRVISLVDGVFQTPQEFFDYLANSLGMTSTKEEQVAIANSILEIMGRYRDNKVPNMNN